MNRREVVKAGIIGVLLLPVGVPKLFFARNKEADIESGCALAFGDNGNYFDVTGTTTITSINTSRVGPTKELRFNKGRTLSYHANELFLPKG